MSCLGPTIGVSGRRNLNHLRGHSHRLWGQSLGVQEGRSKEGAGRTERKAVHLPLDHRDKDKVPKAPENFSEKRQELSTKDND